MFFFIIIFFFIIYLINIYILNGDIVNAIVLILLSCLFILFLDVTCDRNYNIIRII